MTDTTIIKIDSAHSPRGEAGQKYLASGTNMSMRLWESEPENSDKAESKRDYETVGYVIKGKAELHIEGQMVLLNPGDSWSIPKGSSHRYKILESFTAVESTSPPAEVHGRDAGMVDAKNGKNGKDGKDGKDAEHSSENNSVAEFAKATSVEESGVKAQPKIDGAVDKTTEVSPMDKGAEDELDGTAPAKEGETADGKKAEAPAAAAKPEAQEGEKCDAKPEAKAGEKCDAKPLADAENPETKAGEKCDAKPEAKEGEKCESKPEGGAEKKPVDGDIAVQKQTEACADGKKEGESCSEVKAEADDETVKDVQEIAGQIPRTESKVTSNSPEKAPEPAEHVELDKTA